MRKSLVAAAAALALAGCGGGEDGAAGGSCSVREQEIVCDDGTRVSITDGRDGSSCTVADNGDGTRTIACEDGTSVVVRDGADGTSCTATDNGDGTRTVACADGTHVVIADGADGTSCTLVDGDDGTAVLTCTDGTRVVLPVDTCAGGLVAPGFDEAGGWRTSGDAAVVEVGSGHDGPGAGILSGPALCGEDEIAQTICVGSQHERGPAKLTLWQRADCASCQAEAGLRIGGGAAVSLGRVGDAWSKASVCLGEGAYGDAVDFALTAARVPPACRVDPASVPGVWIDDVALEDATPLECPALGEVLNGDFERGELGWSLAGAATIETGPGPAQASLGGPDGCPSARIIGKASVPLASSLPGAALEVEGSGFPRLYVAFGGRNDLLAMLPTGSGVPEVARICIQPVWAGSVVQVELGLGAWSCAPAEAVYRIDDVRIVADPTCP